MITLKEVIQLVTVIMKAMEKVIQLAEENKVTVEMKAMEVNVLQITLEEVIHSVMDILIELEEIIQLAAVIFWYLGP